MSETITLEHIHEDLMSLRQELEIVKEKILDTDEFLSNDDVIATTIARADYKKGKLHSLKDLEKKWR